VGCLVVLSVSPLLNLLIVIVVQPRISMEMIQAKSTTIVLRIAVVLASALDMVAFLSALFLFRRAADMEGVVNPWVWTTWVNLVTFLTL
jgi:hypothetical protein